MVKLSPMPIREKSPNFAFVQPFFKISGKTLYLSGGYRYFSAHVALFIVWENL
jgi:hypothetical protein